MLDSELSEEQAALFSKTLKQWRSYLRSMAERFSKAPDFLPEDAFQIASIVVWEIFRQCNPEERPIEFRKFVKSYVPRRLMDEIRRVKTVSRNADSTVREGDIDESLIPEGGSLADLSPDTHPTFLSPEDSAVWADIRDHIDSDCTEDEKTLVMELLEPSKATLDLFLATEYKRRPSVIPLSLVQRALGWDPERFDRTIKSLRVKLREILS